MKKLLPSIMNFIVKHAAEIIARMQSKSPTMFKNLQKLFGVLAALAGIIDQVIKTGAWSPAQADTILQWCSYILAISAAGFVTSALPVKNVDEKDEKKEKIKDALSSDVVGDRPPPRRPGVDEE